MSKKNRSVKFFGNLFQFSVFSLFALLLIGFFTVVAGFFYFSHDLPNIKSLEDYHPQIVTEVFGSDGSKIGEFWKNGRRVLAPYEEIPPLLANAFIAAEDSRFYQHRGIDFRGMARAFLENLRAGEIVQGGSTITQQVTRSLLLSRTRSYERKIREIILSNRLERYLNKEQILYLYLNEIYLGNRAYGVKAAAQNYFHKELNQLNLAEMALLAGLPKAPEFYSPLKGQERAQERQRYVLNRLFDEGKITEKEMLAAIETTLQVYRQGTDKEANLKNAPYFMEYLRQNLLEKYGEETLYFGGLKVYTSIDPAMQRQAQEALARGLEVIDRRRSRWHGTVGHVAPEKMGETREKQHQSILENQLDYILFPHSGGKAFAITPIQQGKTYQAIVTGFENEKTKISVGRFEGNVPDKDRVFDQSKLSYYNHYYMSRPASVLKVGDIIQVRYQKENQFSFYQAPSLEGAIFVQEPATGFAKAMVGGYDFERSEFNRTMSALRQPGSAFKPFVYTAALDKGYTMNTPVIDTPFAVPVGNEIWAPKNSNNEYRGTVPLKQALAYSYNLAAARVAYHIGFNYIAAYVRKFGIDTELQVTPSMALGANGVHLYQMVSAYALFPNLGKYRPTQFLTKIVNQSGTTLYLHEDSKPASMDDLKKRVLEQDKLTLTQNELEVLFGKSIPKDRMMTPQTAFLMTQLMQEVTRVGSGQAVHKLGRPVAGKTGTTNGNTDAWFVGFTPNLVAGVWLGYDQLKSIGRNEQGGTAAAPIFLDFMLQATEGQPIAEFPIPEGIEMDNMASLKGGSAEVAEIGHFPTMGDVYNTAGTAQDRAADFMGADFESLNSPESAEPIEAVDALDD